MTTNLPVVSVILPVYNAQDYLVQCLDSLIQQTLKNIEIICINDGSTDQSSEILQRYAQKDSRIVFIEQENAGPAVARNQGLAAARGQYLMFCDSDDWFALDACERMVVTLKEASVDLVVCDVMTARDDIDYQRDDEVFHALTLSGYYELPDERKYRVNSVLWNKIFKRELIQQYDICFPISKIAEDSSFVFQYTSVAKNVFGLEEILYYRRLRADSMIGQIHQGKVSFDGLATQKTNFDFLIKHHLWEQNIHYFLWSVFDVFINNIALFGIENRQKCLEITHDLLKYIDFEMLKQNYALNSVRGLKELAEIKENNFSRYIPKRKKGLIFTKEKYADVAHLYIGNIKILSKTQDEYYKEIRILGVRIYKKTNYALMALEHLKQIKRMLIK